jgi:hypothetical protein
MARKEELGRDAEGRFRRYIGWKKGNGDRAIQHLFRLGRDKAEAERRNLLLERLWDCVCNVWKKDKGDGAPCSACPMWDDTTLAIGAAVARGEALCVLQPPAGLGAGAALLWLAAVQQRYPVVNLRLPEETAAAGVPEIQGRVAGLESQRSRLENRLGLETAALKAGGVSVPTAVETLHTALDAYRAHLEQTHKGKPSLRPQLTSLTLIKRHHAETGLGLLDADAIDRWLAYWCRRPTGQSGKTCARDTCRNALIVSRQFLRWLSRSSRFSWVLPAGYVFPRCKLEWTEAERAPRRLSWTVEELKRLWQYAKPWDRALMLLALNAGFSKREIATLQVSEIVVGTKHTFIKRHRTKTHVYAEWVLWPETLAGLEYLSQFRPKGATLAVANQNGRPLTKQTRKGNENGIIRNHWQHVLARVLADHPEFHALSFKYLRKTGATLLRHLPIRNAAELVSMYLAHGPASDSRDALLPVYTDRPWRKLHKALLKLRRRLLPVLESVADPWQPTINRVSPPTVAKVHELRAAGLKLKEIAAQVGLHHITVGKLCRQAGG